MLPSKTPPPKWVVVRASPLVASVVSVEAKTSCANTFFGAVAVPLLAPLLDGAASPSPLK